MSDSEVIQKFSKLVYYIANLKAKQQSDVDDICQEVFLRYVDKGPTFSTDQQARLWFSKVTENVIRNFYGRAEYTWRADVEEEEYESIPSGGDEMSVVEKNVDFEARLGNIPPNCKTAIILRYGYGFTIKETAELMGKTTEQVKALLTRGKREYRNFVLKGDDTQ